MTGMNLINGHTIMRSTYRNDQFGLATYPKDTIRVHGVTGRIVDYSGAHSLEVYFFFEICDTKDEAWYVTSLSASFLRNSSNGR
jgi:hypothetical protein